MNRQLQTFLREEVARLGPAVWPIVESPQDGQVLIEGQWKINLCSNNYLGLANHPAVKDAAIKATEEFGAGTVAARALSGTTPLHAQLEEELADFKKTEAALVFNSGLTTNLGVIPALAGRGDVVLSDEVNHGSIIDGCRLAGAERRVYRHGDMEHLEELLAEVSGFGKRMIVTDTVFSMDGDIASLPEIVELCRRHDAFLMVDEAHATGVLGEHGGGAIDYFGLDGQVDVMMGTLGKALGTVGGYVAGSKDLINYLAKTARTFLLTTSLPAACAGAALAALGILRNSSEIRQRLWDNVNYYRTGLEELGFDTMGTKTAIVPILVGDDKTALHLSQRVFEEGILTTKIGYPYVPHGSARLRTIVSSAHSGEDLTRSLDILKRVGKELALI